MGQDIELSSDATQLGLVAQDVERVVPEAVARGPNGIRHLEISAAVSVLVEALKSQQEKTHALERSVRTLQSRR